MTKICLEFVISGLKLCELLDFSIGLKKFLAFEKLSNFQLQFPIIIILLQTIVFQLFLVFLNKQSE